MRPKGLSMKNSNDTIGNRTRDLLTCSAVPQPTVPPRSPIQWVPGLFSRVKGPGSEVDHSFFKPKLGMCGAELPFLLYASMARTETT